MLEAASSVSDSSVNDLLKRSLLQSLFRAAEHSYLYIRSKSNLLLQSDIIHSQKNLTCYVFNTKYLSHEAFYGHLLICFLIEFKLQCLYKAFLLTLCMYIWFIDLFAHCLEDSGGQ